MILMFVRNAKLLDGLKEVFFEISRSNEYE